MKTNRFLRLLTLLSITIFCCSTAGAYSIEQNPETQKWGIKVSSAWQVSPVWDEIGPVVEGYRYNIGDGEPKKEMVFPVRSGQKWGFIDFKGKVITKPQFDEIGEVSDFEETGSLAQNLERAAIPVKLAGKWGYVTQNGKVGIKPEYDEIGKFYTFGSYNTYSNERRYEKEGYVVARKGNEFFILNKKGKKKESLGSKGFFKDGVAIVKDNNGWYAPSDKEISIKEEGNLLCIRDYNNPTLYYDLESKILFSKSDDNAIILETNDKRGIGIMENNTIVVPPVYDEKPKKVNDLYIVTSNKKRGLYNPVVKQEIVNCIYDNIIGSDYLSNIWYLGNGQSYELRNIFTDELILPEKYDRFNEIPNTSYVVLGSDGTFGLFDLASKRWILPKEFNSIKANDSEGLRNFFIVEKPKDMFGIFSVNDNDFIVPTENRMIRSFAGNQNLNLITNKIFKCGIYDLKEQEWIIPQEYKDIKCWDNEKGLYLVYGDDGLMGMFDLNQQKQIIPIQYEDFWTIGPSKTYLLAKQNNKYGVISSKTGKTVLPAIYDEVKGVDDYDDFKVTINGRRGYYDTEKGGWLANPDLYEDYSFLKGRKIAVKKNGNWGVIDYDGKQVKPFQYASVEKIKLEMEKNQTTSNTSTTSQYSPAGIKYRNYSDGVTISIYFNPHNNWGRIDLEYGAAYGFQQYTVSFTWTCNGTTVKINPQSMLFPATTFTISKDRKTLSENNNGKVTKYYRVN